MNEIEDDVENVAISFKCISSLFSYTLDVIILGERMMTKVKNVVLKKYSSDVITFRGVR